MRFTYHIRDISGQSAAGVLTAADLNDASRQLRRDGKIIVSLKPESDDTAAKDMGITWGAGRVKSDDVIFFATQLAVMVETGVPLSDALDSIIDGTKEGTMRNILQDVNEQVKGGVEFSTAMEKYPKVFGKQFVAMVRASEASGTLGTMLQRVSEYLEQDRDLRKKIKGAMTYPVCMLVFCTLVVTALLIFVLPRFEKIYAGKGAVLPAPTRILLATSRGIITYWPLILLGIAGVVTGACLFARSPRGKIILDDIRLKLPVIGEMMRKACLARSLRTFSSMISSGVSMLDTLAMAAEISGNHFYDRMWSKVAEKVREGASLSDELAASPLMPRSFTQMIAAGERTGKLGPVMNRAAAFCESDLKVSIKSVTDLIEPVMIIIMGFIVGGVAISLLLPIFNISKVMTH